MPETICLFGGAGFLGSRLTRDLLNKGYRVVVADNLYRHASHLTPLFEEPNFELVICDVTNKADIRALSKRENIDKIVILSALVGEPICKKYPSLSHAVTVNGTELICDWFDAIPRLYISTGSVYGNIPQDEIAVESRTIHPISEYSVHKAQAEDFALSYGGAVYRLSTAMGMSYAQRLRLLPHELVWDAVHNRTMVVFQKDSQRSFVSVRDICRAIIQGIEQFDKIKGEVFNVGHPLCNWTKEALAKYIAKKTGSALFFGDTGYIDPDKRSYSVSFDKIHKAIGWQAEDTMEKVIDQLIPAMKIFPYKPNFD